VQQKLKSESIVHEVRGNYLYYEAKLRPDVYVAPTLDDRREFERMFEISVADQLELEAYLDAKSNDEPLDHAVIDKIMLNTDYHRFVALYKR